MEQLVGEEDSPFRPRDHAQVEEDGAVAAVEAAGELRGIVGVGAGEEPEDEEVVVVVRALAEKGREIPRELAWGGREFRDRTLEKNAGKAVLDVRRGFGLEAAELGRDRAFSPI